MSFTFIPAVRQKQKANGQKLPLNSCKPQITPQITHHSRYLNEVIPQLVFVI
jgi:hypothetical protein